MTDTQPPGPYVQQKLTREQAVAYLERISLSPDLINAPASLDLLTTITLAQLEQIPKDTSPLHVSEEQWKGPADTPIKLSSNSPGMPLGTASLDRIVKEHKVSLSCHFRLLSHGQLGAQDQRERSPSAHCIHSATPSIGRLLLLHQRHHGGLPSSIRVQGLGDD